MSEANEAWHGYQIVSTFKIYFCEIYLLTFLVHICPCQQAGNGLTGAGVPLELYNYGLILIVLALYTLQKRIDGSESQELAQL